jgi:hypothetical protein
MNGCLNGVKAFGAAAITCLKTLSVAILHGTSGDEFGKAIRNT